MTDPLPTYQESDAASVRAYGGLSTAFSDKSVRQGFIRKVFYLYN